MEVKEEATSRKNKRKRDREGKGREGNRTGQDRSEKMG